MADGRQAGAETAPGEDPFHHEALFYSGEDGFLRGTLPFIADALAAEEPLMVAVRAERAALLRDTLKEEAHGLQFADVGTLAGNPARVIPAWREFLNEHARQGRRVRGIGEPVWPGRAQDELGECERHESLLNIAFADLPGWRLLCLYDLDGLDPQLIDAARLSHPFIADEDGGARNGEYVAGRTARPFDGSLPAPASPPDELAFTAGGLAEVRIMVARRAREAQLSDSAREDLVLAINELVTNSVQHGGGGGTLAIWTDGEQLFCEVRDKGRIEDPLAGRIPPPRDRHGGRGLWLVNHLCDLVQIRSTPAGNVVRVRMRRG